MSGPSQVLGWLQFGFHLLLALAFGILAIVLARRAGKGGSYVLAALAAVDLLGIVSSRVLWLMVRSMPYSRVDAILDLSEVLNLGFELLSCALVLLACALLRKAPAQV